MDIIIQLSKQFITIFMWVCKGTRAFVGSCLWADCFPNLWALIFPTVSIPHCCEFVNLSHYTLVSKIASKRLLQHEFHTCTVPKYKKNNIFTNSQIGPSYVLTKNKWTTHWKIMYLAHRCEPANSQNCLQAHLKW